MLDKELLDILVCPQCKGALKSVDGATGLVCNHCQLKYPIRDDIPIMLVSEALDQRRGASKISSVPQSFPKAFFSVINGPDRGLKFNVERQTCRALGRGEEDAGKTIIFNVDLALSIDESTKALILQYIAKQFSSRSKSATMGGREKGESLGLFRRAPDVVLTDQSLSRLHAMIFADESEVGVLDLVSKNGTFINGEEVESKLLKRGDIIELGETKIQFEG